jgi:hypothetical protein
MKTPALGTLFLGNRGKKPYPNLIERICDEAIVMEEREV